MSPGNSSAGSLTTTRLPAENPGEKFTADLTAVPRQKQRRHADRIFVWAHTYLVVGTRGRCRLVMVVPDCPWCHRPHAHNGKPDFISGRRTASCHEGRYVVLVGTVEGEVAS